LAPRSRALRASNLGNVSSLVAAACGILYPSQRRADIDRRGIPGWHFSSAPILQGSLAAGWG
jgi:hypothetical protein